MSVRHKKRVAANRPDGVDATIVQGIGDWGNKHSAPDMLAYMYAAPSGVTVVVPGTNQPDTEIPDLRSKFDFTYAEEVRLVCGYDYGSARIFFKYSIDLLTWYPLDGVNGPSIQQAEGNAAPTVKVSPWVTLAAGARGDRWIAAFYGQNTNTSIFRIHTLWLHVR